MFSTNPSLSDLQRCFQVPISLIQILRNSCIEDYYFGGPSLQEEMTRREEYLFQYCTVACSAGTGRRKNDLGSHVSNVDNYCEFWDRQALEGQHAVDEMKLVRCWKLVLIPCVSSH